jgi:GTP-binding protein Era
MRCGFVALVGRPNVGKSTLLNALVGGDVSIVASLPQTTRDRILAVVTREGAQAVFVDSPGIHRPHGPLGERMNREASSAVSDADVLIMVADATDGVEGVTRDAHVFAQLESARKPVLLALNKVDRVKPRTALLPVIEAYTARRAWASIVPIAARNRDGLPRLLDACMELLPEGPMLFPPDALTDRPERYLAAERVREAVIHETADELPYVTAVEIERFDEGGPAVHIGATIHVERDGQKKIVIGAGGAQIKAIGTRARKAIEKMLGRKVMLELWVKVTPGWTRDAGAMARLGYGASGPGRPRR